MKTILNLSLLSFLITASSFVENPKDIEIEWVKNLKGDFSFYPKHTLSCDAWCYEFAGASEINVKQISKDSIECWTTPNQATHSTLNFYIINNTVKNARIELIGIVNHNSTYPCTLGSMKIDKEFIKKNVLKADFNMEFNHPENPKKKMYWKGKIVAKIER